MEDIYLSADKFFSKCSPFGLTFDDVSLVTRYSELLPREVGLDTNLTEDIKLSIPIISSDMDTVTEAEMATAMALSGGIGIIHYNMSPKQQVKELTRVKYHVHGLIQDPITIAADEYVGDVLNIINEKNFKFRTFPVVDKIGKLLGLLPGRVVKERYRQKKVTEVMLQRDQVYVIRDTEVGKDPILTADKFFSDHIGIHKLLVVDSNDKLKGLYTLSDIEQIIDENSDKLKPTRDSSFRLRCGAALNVPRNDDGKISKNQFIDHVGEMVDKGLDIGAISTAHGHTKSVGEAINILRDAFPSLPIMAGNVTTPEGVKFLAEAGANSIKIGQGPGSICTTRIVAGVGVPQMTALHWASTEKVNHNISIIADGGINKSGDMVKALTMADAVICGGLLAGCKESPGRVIEIEGKYYKQYRGMGSLEAMKHGSAARYGHRKEDLNSKSTPEGIEALKEVSSSLKETLEGLAGGIRSGLGYLGAKDLNALRKHARFVRVTPAGQRESAPHDVIQVKSSDFIKF